MYVCLTAYVQPDGVPTTTPPKLPRPELWITVSLLLLIMAGSVCGLMVFLCFRRAHCRLRNIEDHDVTMLKVPSGEDPTYGVRDIWCWQNTIKRCSSFLVVIYGLSHFPGYLWWVLYIREWDRAALSGPTDYGQTDLSCRVCWSVSFFTTAAPLCLFSVLSRCVIVSLCSQVKGGMGRCGEELGWGRVWQSRSSPQGTSNPGSERRRSIIQYSCDTTIYWVQQQTSFQKILFLIFWFASCGENSTSKWISQKTDIEIAIFCSGFRFHSLWHDIQEFQHPAVARHPLSWVGFTLWLPTVQQLGAWELPEDVLVCGLRSSPPPYWDCQLPGQTSYRPPRPEKPKHPGKAERTVLHRWPRWGLSRGKDRTSQLDF